MINWKLYERKQSWPDPEITRNLLEGIEESHEGHQSRYAKTSPILNKSAAWPVR